MPPPPPLRVALHHHLEVVPPVRGCPAFPVCEAIVRSDEGVGAQLLRSSRPASGAWCRSGLGWLCDERVWAGRVRDPYPPLVWVVVVEPPDRHVDEVIWGTLSQAEEHLELPHTDVGSSMSKEERREAPVGADTLEMWPEGVHQVIRSRSVVDIVCRPYFLQVEGVARVQRPWG